MSGKAGGPNRRLPDGAPTCPCAQAAHAVITLDLPVRPRRMSLSGAPDFQEERVAVTLQDNAQQHSSSMARCQIL